MEIQVLIAIAQLCAFSVAPAAFGGSAWRSSDAYNSRAAQLACQKYLIRCVRDDKRKWQPGHALADCVLSLEWKESK